MHPHNPIDTFLHPPPPALAEAREAGLHQEAAVPEAPSASRTPGNLSSPAPDSCTTRLQVRSLLLLFVFRLLKFLQTGVNKES